MSKSLSYIFDDLGNWVIKGNYACDRFGNIISLLSGRPMIQRYNTKGYLRFWHKGKQVLSHRFIMSAWYGESELEVDHLNGVKDCNDLSNLEYVTSDENRRRRKKGIYKHEPIKYDDVPF